MKCKICNHMTDWDSSYGYINFIVCRHCHDKIYKTIGKKNFQETMKIIFTLGEIAKGEF